MTEDRVVCDVTCRHCVAVASSAGIDVVLQSDPRGPSLLLDLWTCPECGWRNVANRTPVENG